MKAGERQRRRNRADTCGHEIHRSHGSLVLPYHTSSHGRFEASEDSSALCRQPTITTSRSEISQLINATLSARNIAGFRRRSSELANEISGAASAKSRLSEDGIQLIYIL